LSILYKRYQFFDKDRIFKGSLLMKCYFGTNIKVMFSVKNISVFHDVYSEIKLNNHNFERKMMMKMKIIFWATVSSLLLCLFCAVSMYFPPESLLGSDMLMIIGGEAESTDCLPGGRDCPYEENPVGGANTACPAEGDICTGNAAAKWCQDVTTGEICTGVTYSYFNWACVTDPDHTCVGYERKCVDMLGSLVCAGQVASGQANCGVAPQCHY
jgi:hypothetical protein